MKRRLKQQRPTEDGRAAVPTEAIFQVKVWLIGISPMVWRRVLVSAAFTLCELHGVIQVAMGWDGSISTNSACAPRATGRGRRRRPRPR